MLSPSEFVGSYIGIGQTKARSSALRLLILGMLAGFLVGCGACVANTASHALDNQSVIRIVCGLLFPFNLFMITVLGAELFTGNCLVSLSVLDRRVKLSGMLRNWLLVYTGNFLGGCLLALCVTAAGQMDLSGGALAAYTIKVASAKCSLSFGKALLLGVGCNILVCIAVVCAGCAKSVPGKAVGAYLPVSFFVICGFEHSVANMYYIPAGLFATAVPRYAAVAAGLGIDASGLSWGRFLLGNLLPVTLGNIIGGLLVAFVLWFGQYQPVKQTVTSE